MSFEQERRALERRLALALWCCDHDGADLIRDAITTLERHHYRETPLCGLPGAPEHSTP